MDRNTLRTGLVRAIAPVNEDLQPTTDEGDLWQHVTDALAAVNRWDNYLQQQVPGYLEQRAASEEGRMTAGLVWFRGAVEHRLVQNSKLDWLESTTFYKGEDGELHKSQTFALNEDGELRPVRHMFATYVWPAHVDDRTERHSRDEWYRDLVQGGILTGPLRRALAFLDSFAVP